MNATIKVRPTGVLIEGGRLLLLRQAVTVTRRWSLPGGALEPGETIGQCLVREMKEETGLDVRVGEFLYLTDRFLDCDTHIVHIMFLVARAGTEPLPDAWTNLDPHPSATVAKRREIRMVPFTELEKYGFSWKFRDLVTAGFPGRGGYRGNFNDFYGEAAP